MKRFLLNALVALSALCLAAGAQAGSYDDMLVAIKEGDAGNVKEILDKGLDANIVDKAGNTLLMLAVRDSNDDIVALLIAHRANLNSLNANGDTALGLAALRGSLPMVKRLVEAGAQVDTPNWSPLMYAAFNGHADVVEYLLGRGASIDAQAKNGFTPLIAASRNGSQKTVALLLKRGAKPNLLTQTNETAMDWALKNNNTDAANMLRKVGGLSGKAMAVNPKQ